MYDKLFELSLSLGAIKNALINSVRSDQPIPAKSRATCVSIAVIKSVTKSLDVEARPGENDLHHDSFRLANPMTPILRLRMAFDVVVSCGMSSTQFYQHPHPPT
jgi:hypothetical protein